MGFKGDLMLHLDFWKSMSLRKGDKLDRTSQPNGLSQFDTAIRHIGPMLPLGMMLELMLHLFFSAQNVMLQLDLLKGIRAICGMSLN